MIASWAKTSFNPLHLLEKPNLIQVQRRYGCWYVLIDTQALLGNAYWYHHFLYELVCYILQTTFGSLKVTLTIFISPVYTAPGSFLLLRTFCLCSNVWSDITEPSSWLAYYSIQAVLPTGYIPLRREDTCYSAAGRTVYCSPVTLQREYSKAIYL